MPSGVYIRKKGVYKKPWTKIHRERFIKSMLGHLVNKETRRKIGEANKISLKNYYIKHHEAKEKIRIRMKGKVAWNKGLPSPKKGTHYTEQEKINHLKSVRRGKDCHFWKGGVALENDKLRKSFEYKLWRKAVFERDNYTCIWCGQKGGRLDPDHIKPWSLFPELRFAIDNGRTLCHKCHLTTDTYAGKMNNKNLLQKLEAL